MKICDTTLYRIKRTEHEPNTNRTRTLDMPVRFGSNSGEPNIQANRTLGVTVRLGSCSPGNEPDLCSVRPMFGSVRPGSVRQAHSDDLQMWLRDLAAV